jgi:hypothetical protein
VTPGRLLIAGDLVTYQGGHIAPSPDVLAVDPDLHRASVGPAVALPVEHFVDYHGGHVPNGAEELLRPLR